MSYITKYVGLSAATAALLVAAPFMASANNDNHKDDKGGVKAALGLNIGAGIQHVLYGTPLPSHATTTAHGSISTNAVVTAVNGSTLTVKAKGDTTYTVNAANASEIKVGDSVHIKGKVNGSTITAEKIVDAAIQVRSHLSANGAAGAGVVTSINGSTFTIKPFGTKATTTVSTTASTTYRVNGDLASSSALQVGSKVVLAGTTNSDTSISATIVGILSAGWGHFKHWSHR